MLWQTHVEIFSIASQSTVLKMVNSDKIIPENNTEKVISRLREGGHVIMNLLS